MTWRTDDYRWNVFGEYQDGTDTVDVSDNVGRDVFTKIPRAHAERICRMHNAYVEAMHMYQLYLELDDWDMVQASKDEITRAFKESD